MLIVSFLCSPLPFPGFPLAGFVCKVGRFCFCYLPHLQASIVQILGSNVALNSAVKVLCSLVVRCRIPVLGATRAMKGQEGV